MVKSLLISVLASALVPATAALAQAQPARAAPGATTAAQESPDIVVEGKKEKKVCRKFPPKTGSRFGDRRECKTIQEWRIADSATKRVIDRENTRGDANRAQDWNAKNQSGMGGPLPR